MISNEDDLGAVEDILEKIIESSSSANNSASSPIIQVDLSKISSDNKMDSTEPAESLEDNAATNVGALQEGPAENGAPTSPMIVDSPESCQQIGDPSNNADDNNDSPHSDAELQETHAVSRMASDHIEEEYNDDADSVSTRGNAELIKDIIPTIFIPDAGSDRNNGNGAEEEEERDYVVEKILQKKLDAKGRALYLIKWEGFPSSDNTWEPIQNLVECDKKMQEFELNGGLKLSKRYKLEQANATNRNNNTDQTNGKKGKPANDTKKKIAPKSRLYREFPVMDVMGMTEFNEERYYLVSIANSTRKPFIRASLAKRIFPAKIIDFYVKNLKWKQKVELGPV